MLLFVYKNVLRSVWLVKRNQVQATSFSAPSAICRLTQLYIYRPIFQQEVYLTLTTRFQQALKQAYVFCLEHQITCFEVLLRRCSNEGWQSLWSDDIRALVSSSLSVFSIWNQRNNVIIRLGIAVMITRNDAMCGVKVDKNLVMSQRVLRRLSTLKRTQ